MARLLAEFRTWFGKSSPSDRAMREVVDRLITREDTEFLLAEVDGRAVAVAQVRYRLSVWTGAEDCWLEDLFVEEAARGAGLGRALAEAVVERARARGCGRVELDVDAVNAPARALYAAVGFRDKGDGGTLFLQCPLV